MKPFSYYDLLERFAEPGCTVCALLKAAQRRYLSALLYEFVTDPGAQAQFRAARGLCNPHAWALHDQREGLVGIAILYEQAISEWLERLNEVEPPANNGGLGRLFRRNLSGAGRLAPERGCGCCAQLAETERYALETLRDGLAEPSFRENYLSSTGLCLPHLARLLPMLRDPSAFKCVYDHQREQLSALREQLDLFIARYGERGDGAPMGDEATSWRRAIALLAGEIGVFGFDHAAFNAKDEGE
ncbi:MAG: DUF6062 family protein [Aggregatilineales bacterium]